MSKPIPKDVLAALLQPATRINQVGIKVVKTFRIVKTTRGFAFDLTKCRPERNEKPNEPKIIVQVEGKIVEVLYFNKYRDATDYLRELKNEVERGGDGEIIKITSDSLTVADAEKSEIK